MINVKFYKRQTNRTFLKKKFYNYKVTKGVFQYHQRKGKVLMHAKSDLPRLSPTENIWEDAHD